ncbi:MAG: 5-formyltetrahydrofolate cyclo-ligase, partial [Peptostreptococcaceae bacterium]|nr:5-formyltetrahydrofolate cyclo-ligase [Peptostreptococcaceae bacterium]
DKKDIDMIITPCVCYDYQKYRVGYGKGFYDRFFDNISPYKLGICFDECIVEKIDINDYDVAVDMVITDKRVFI